MKQNRRICAYAACLAAGLVLLGLGLDPAGVVPGLGRILTEPDILITDYLAVGGLGAALVNAGLVTLLTIGVIRLSGDECHGFTVTEIGLMAGFSLFGKNPVNILPILLGAWLYARVRREPFRRYLAVALLSTALAPLVSWLMFGSAYGSAALGIAAGVLIGFLMPVIAAHTFHLLNGVNLYNVGFACGLLALMAVPILSALGDSPAPVLLWSEVYSLPLGTALTVLCLLCMGGGLFGCGARPAAVLHRWRRLLATTGQAPVDYLRQFGLGPVLWNMGVNGLCGIAYILLVGGTFNGPTAGGVLTVMAFSTYGKHLRNMVPVMAGVALGACFLHRSPAAAGMQLAGLFGTTLAPVAGMFGWPAGVLAGVLHSALVAQTGGPVAGMNLYNNGFSGGLIALVLYPLLTALRRRRPKLQDRDYLDSLEGNLGPEEP